MVAESVDEFIIDECGHWVPEEQPEAMAKAFKTYPPIGRSKATSLVACEQATCNGETTKKRVLCLSDNKEETLRKSTLGRQRIDGRRPHLICMACGGKASLRRCHGARPTFGARQAEGRKVLVTG